MWRHASLPESEGGLLPLSKSTNWFLVKALRDWYQHLGLGGWRSG